MAKRRKDTYLIEKARNLRLDGEDTPVTVWLPIEVGRDETPPSCTEDALRMIRDRAEPGTYRIVAVKRCFEAKIEQRPRMVTSSLPFSG